MKPPTAGQVDQLGATPCKGTVLNELKKQMPVVVRPTIRRDLLILLPARARRGVPFQQSATLRIPQLAASVAAPDQEFLDLGIGITVARFFAAAFRAVPHEDAIDKVFSSFAV